MLAIGRADQDIDRRCRRPVLHLRRLRPHGGLIGATTWALIADAIIELTRHRRDGEPLN
jgi:hypothetical protein